MPAVVIGDVFLLTFNGTYFGQRIMLTHHYLATAADGTSTEADFANALLAAVKSGGDDDIETPYAECLTTDYTCNTIWAQKIRVGRYRRQEVAGTEAGTLTATEVSTVAASLVMQTSQAGRNQQAVKKIGPLPTHVDYISNGVLTSTMQIALSLLGTALTAQIELPFSMGTVAPCIYHGEAPFPAPTIITKHTVPTTARSNRRRTVGLGI